MVMASISSFLWDLLVRTYPRCRPGEGRDGTVFVAPPTSLSPQYQIAIRIHPPAPAGRDDSGGVELLDDRRAADRGADLESIAFVENGVGRAATLFLLGLRGSVGEGE